MSHIPFKRLATWKLLNSDSDFYLHSNYFMKTTLVSRNDTLRQILWSIQYNNCSCASRVSWTHKRHLLSRFHHHSDVIMSPMASQITSVSIVCLTVSSGASQRKHQSSASLAFAREIHRLTVDFPRKGPVTRKMFPSDDVIIMTELWGVCCEH